MVEKREPVLQAIGYFLFVSLQILLLTVPITTTECEPCVLLYMPFSGVVLRLAA